MASTGRIVTKTMGAHDKAARTVVPTKSAAQRSAVLRKVFGSVHARSAVTGRYVKPNAGATRAK
ncbi:hypothetical protein [Arsenicicoccus bolidensis]|uniref:Uncharacterized protein n=1 Tax=Arsenicicoccus bolidensis TaxID=229480 RepID=A0ABS9Q134_9MICO|nr:hypothetical protein [Arsenicicoccus bolidensis]MCG7321577.1 hypothetical protein [Arsenicicoccus bolidensis]